MRIGDGGDVSISKSSASWGDWYDFGAGELASDLSWFTNRILDLLVLIIGHPHSNLSALRLNISLLSLFTSFYLGPRNIDNLSGICIGINQDSIGGFLLILDCDYLDLFGGCALWGD